MATRFHYTDLCQNSETLEDLSMPGPCLSYKITKYFNMYRQRLNSSCLRGYKRLWHAGNMAILMMKSVKIEFLPINIRNKDGRYLLVVYVLGAFLILINLNIFIPDESHDNLLCIQRL